MKAVHWLFLISIGLFISGVGFVVVGARSARQVAPVHGAIATPVATIKQIMKGIVAPNATIVYNAVGVTITAQGTEERAPKSDEEWEIVGNSAAALIESSNLLLMGSRVMDNGDWVK